MIARDRELLCRAAEVMHSFGPVVVELMQRQDGGELPAAPVREVGNAFVALAHDFLDRADELDARAIENRTAEGGDGAR
ncbi:hypothetical protein [Saccharomonospora iraqiensis]|uniref:hypothetical protein n=1 Tax=Saccharomonospora iraqiensis TaxID=52698 RepID=UPI00022E194E|nr:hypothetical protein [Saccharomonospora iraqiensis]